MQIWPTRTTLQIKRKRKRAQAYYYIDLLTCFCNKIVTIAEVAL